MLKQIGVFFFISRLKGDNALFEDDQFRHDGSSLGNNLETDHPEIEWIRATELPHLKIAKQTPYVYYPKAKTYELEEC